MLPRPNPEIIARTASIWPRPPARSMLWLFGEWLDLLANVMHHDVVVFVQGIVILGENGL